VIGKGIADILSEGDLASPVMCGKYHAGS
jgi:hypothetical protein